MRKPNGYGSIKKLSGKRRRPYVFVVTQAGRQKPIAYFCTQVEAEIYAADYNKIHTNRSLPGHKMTFAELYYRWLPAHIGNISPAESTIYSYKNAFSHCQPLHTKIFADIKYVDYQRIIDNMHRHGLSYSSVKKIRSLISLISKYAAKIEVSDKNYAQLLTLGKNKPTRPHKVFSRQKINRLWAHADTPGVDTVIILMYTGMRCSEMLNLDKSDVNLRQQYIRITKSKTAAGLRIIPIHNRILPLVQARMKMPGQTLIADGNGQPYNYGRYATVWGHIMTLIHASGHTTHDCRHTVTTLLDNAGANENAKRRILGHANGDVTDRVYTHKNLRQLRKCIELLK